MGDKLSFSNLSIHQRLADVNSFSFIWRVEREKASLGSHVDFYKQALGKEVTITINETFVFKGIIQSINCFNQYVHNVEYEISGKGLLLKLDEVPQCRSFVQQSIRNIFETLNQPYQAPLKLEPKHTDNLYYTVQYNQTIFEFFRMLAARHGEWFYYTGSEMILGKPDSTVKKIKVPSADIFDITISARMHKSSEKVIAFDPYKGEVITDDKAITAPQGTGLIAAAMEAGNNTFGNNHTHAHFAHAATDPILKNMSTLNQHSRSASSVLLSGRSYLNDIKLCGTIELSDSDGGSAGQYFVTELHHTCQNESNYQNHFIAIPSEAATPPYTDPHLFPYCKPQPATVTKNEDKDGLARIKVRFSWQDKGEESPWLSVVVPHAGKEKGFRFLPEVNDEVMVDFINNNAERPFVLGAVYSDKDKPDVPHNGNHIKVIGTKTGRRLEFDDDQGYLVLSDNYSGKMPKNLLYQRRNNEGTYAILASHKSDEAFSRIELTNEESIEISLVSGGNALASVLLQKEGKKITIRSKGSVQIEANGAINMSASEINMNAGGTMKISKEGIEVNGNKIEMTADTDFKATANANAEISGNAKAAVSGNGELELSGGAMASLSAALVKIN